jgi:hypothetical protein
MRSSRRQHIENTLQRIAIDPSANAHPHARLKLNFDKAAVASRAMAPVRSGLYRQIRRRFWPRCRCSGFTHGRHLHPRENRRRSICSPITRAAKLSIEKLSAPRVKLSGIDFVPLDRARHRRARRKGFAEDRQLLLNRPDAPTRDAFNDLNAGGTTTHTTGRKTTRIALNLASHPALRQNTQTAKLSLQAQGGAQTTLTVLTRKITTGTCKQWFQLGTILDDRAIRRPSFCAIDDTLKLSPNES